MKIDQENLLTAVQRLVDEADIRRTLFEYAHYLDHNDVENLVGLFVADCHIAYGPDHGAQGIAAYRETLEHEKVGVGAFFAGISHHVSNVVIDFIGDDEAQVRSQLYAWHRYNRERADGVVMGQYHDIVVRTAAGWRIKRRELKHVGAESYHAKPEALNMIPRRNNN